MQFFVAIFTAFLLIAFIANPLLAGGWFWEIGNGIGIAALAGLLFMAIDGRKGNRWRGHQLAGYLVLVTTLGHSLWFLLGDTTTWEYLKPGAPWYMWSGLIALLLLAVLVVIALPSYRLNIHASQPVFLRWHLWLSVLLIGLSLYHVVGSGFYYRSWWQYAGLAVVSLVVLCTTRGLLQRFNLRSPAPISLLLVSAIGVALFAGVKNINL